MYPLFEKYGMKIDREELDSRLAEIASGLKSTASVEILKTCFSLMDLTTLHTSDTDASVSALVDKVNALPVRFPDCPLPASICVFPNLAHVVRDRRKCSDVRVTAVSSCFPSAQSFLEVKVRECEMAVADGAEEVDIVLALNAFLAGEYDRAYSEIKAMRDAVDAEGEKCSRKVVLKVILETGLLQSPESIAEASLLAMEAGADFIKTSTGKVDVNATPMAALVMCRCIARFFEATGRKVGFKAAGGISSARDALHYHSIVASELGSEWLNSASMRFGVSRLANSLLSEITRESIMFF